MALGNALMGIRDELDEKTDAAETDAVRAELAADVDHLATEVGTLQQSVQELAESWEEETGLRVDTATVGQAGLDSVFVVECGAALGSGFAYEVEPPSGFTTAVVTNHHVVEDCIYSDGPAVSLTLGESTREAELWSWDSEHDLALLFTSHEAPPLEDADEPRIGDPVLVLGAPLGLAGTVTQGIVSNVYSDAIQTDASVDYGNSGGPLIDRFGRVLGVVSMGSNLNTNIAWRTTLLCDQILECP